MGGRRFEKWRPLLLLFDRKSTHTLRLAWCQKVNDLTTRFDMTYINTDCVGLTSKDHKS